MGEGPNSYRVLEASTSDDAVWVLDSGHFKIDVVLSGVELRGSVDGFGFAQWLKAHYPMTKVILAGSPKSTAAAAGHLCEEGPHLAHPYEPAALESYIRRMLANQKSRQS